MHGRFWFLVALVASVLICGNWLSAQEKKEGTEAKAEPRVRGQLPPNYGNLGLDDKQKQEIYKLRASYDEKVADLEAQIKKLKQEERTAIEKLLTPAQKARLKEIMKEKSGLGDDKKETKEKVDK